MSQDLPRRLRQRLAAGGAVLSLGLGAALPASGQQAERATGGLWQQDTLTGDWGGLRSRFAEQGVSLDISEIDEVLADVSGGARRGTVFEGKTQAQLTLDLGRLVHWQGGQFVVSAYQIHGRGLSGDDIGNLLTVSNIEAERGTRLADLYLEQSLLNNRLNIRIGQFAADEEFLTSDTAGVFVNATFGWPGITGVDLPGGGPAYPYSTPGVRVRYVPTGSVSLQGAVFNGNPLGRRGDPGGAEFPFDGVFAIVEATLSTQPAKGSSGLGGTFKLGAWYSSLRFDDLRNDDIGLSLADPASSGTPAAHGGEFGLYASVDHQLWRKPGTQDGGLAGFLRVATAPQQDRNPIYLYLDSGLTWKGTFPGRDDDIVGVAFAWANLSDALRGLDHDTVGFTGVAQPVRSAEMVVEVTYQAALAPWLSVQPDFQYVIHPGGNVPDPINPRVTLQNAVVLGVRSTIRF